ncbi:hypothetical protein TRIP_C20543 [Candidatus Zixiibacteriota bacterium]|nr:hypothetical protein TRIP_C20543 [candidate division Zixibacteria bacterium]
MPQIHKSLEKIEAFCRYLEAEAMEAINFDDIRAVLENSVQDLKGLSQIAAELACLKEEYRARIAGMLRANLASRKDEDDAELLCRVSDSFEGIEAEELVRLYDRTVRRFRENFPASFKYLAHGAERGARRDWSEHKI